MVSVYTHTTMSTSPSTFGHDGRSFVHDGRPFRIFSGEIHYFRIPRACWRHRLQAARAMGLNTVSVYMPWNLHEPRPGEFDFDDNLDVEAFLSLAGDEGLKVILRPGPYICAEWDFGGLPPWLLATPDIKVRCLDPRYLAAVERYFTEVGRRLSTHLVKRGGNVILVQVENEYGAFGNDRAYMDAMVTLVRRVGFDGQLYTCDWAQPGNLKAGEVAGAVTVANFGSRAAEQIPLLRQLRPHQPSMCGEFWAGWFDAWGEPRKGSDDPAPVLAELTWMLENDTSFNFYMFHGGTSFGLMAGANHYDHWAPTVSSYDYWAPLDEAGRPTAKYFAIRELLAKYHEGPLPPVPEAPLPIVAVAPFVPTESAALLANLPAPVAVPQPVPMEALGQNYGVIVYRTDIAGLGDHELEIVEPHDFASVWLNGRLVGTLDRRFHESKVQLSGVPSDKAVLDIVVDTMGRTNFGPKLLDRKGITDRVVYGEWTLMGWQVYRFPLDAGCLASLKWQPDDQPGPAFHRATFVVDQPGDAFLDLGAWGRGVVWVNGRCLGRFWHIGPQRTCYLPGAWLRAGANEVVVFEGAVDEVRGRKVLEGLVRPLLGSSAAGS
jgi:beta-galactosidase